MAPRNINEVNVALIGFLDLPLQTCSIVCSSFWDQMSFPFLSPLCFNEFTSHSYSIMVKWIVSNEEEMLRKHISNGLSSESMAPIIVYDMHDGAYHKLPFSRCKVNLKNLIESMKQNLNNALMYEERIEAEKIDS